MRIVATHSFESPYKPLNIFVSVYNQQRKSFTIMCQKKKIKKYFHLAIITLYFNCVIIFVKWPLSSSICELNFTLDELWRQSSSTWCCLRTLTSRQWIAFEKTVLLSTLLTENKIKLVVVIFSIIYQINSFNCYSWLSVIETKIPNIRELTVRYSLMEKKTKKFFWHLSKH
jgi:hypothetical protein